MQTHGYFVEKIDARTLIELVDITCMPFFMGYPAPTGGHQAVRLFKQSRSILPTFDVSFLYTTGILEVLSINQ
jgi:hypothetical protein